MDHEIELVTDGEGLAIIGHDTAIERFVRSMGLPAISTSRVIRTSTNLGAAASQVGADLASNSGRWLKLTEESAKNLKDLSLIPTDTPGVSHAMLGQRGSVAKWLQVESSASLATNPAVLSGVAGVMTQLAMQQAVDETVDYLAVIDAKLDDVLRTQTNQVLSRLDGVDLALREAMSIRDSVGRVSDVTWSKVQSSAQTIHETQGFALRQINDVADRLERQTRISDLRDAAEDAERDVQKWIVVLSSCFELHDQVAVIELDRVLDAAPDELDRHRLGLRTARQERRDLIAQRTAELLDRMGAAVERANSKVLFNPVQSPAVVRSSNQVASDVHEFREVLGIDASATPSEARPWSEAASEQWDRLKTTGTAGVDVAKEVGGGRLDAARSGLSSVRDVGAARLKAARKFRDPRTGGDTPDSPHTRSAGADRGRRLSDDNSGQHRPPLWP